MNATASPHDSPPAHSDAGEREKLETIRTMAEIDGSEVRALHLIAGYPRQSGTPVLSLALRYDPCGNIVQLRGQALIFPSEYSENGHVIVDNVCGMVRAVGHGDAVRSVSLKGMYWRPATDGNAEPVHEQFLATFLTDSQWCGRGTFVYGGEPVANINIGQA